jgi:aldose 1-epimerase
MVTLTGAGWALTLLPALGGAIGALRFRGTDILRPTADGETDPLQSACFPLVPYANRIAEGRFAFGGRKVAVPLNFGEHPNSLHGFGWQRPWGAIETRPDRARLAHSHVGDNGWPWRYHAEQLFQVGEDGVAVTLTVTNKSSEPMPVGIGLHPYFPASPRTRLRFRSERVWLTGPTQIPTGAVAADHFGDWTLGLPVQAAGFVDHSYAQWDGSAALDQGDRTVVMTAEGARDLHLFIPEDASFCCLEPVSHLPDAFNRLGAAFDVLAPGGSLSLTMRIAVEAN